MHLEVVGTQWKSRASCACPCAGPLRAAYWPSLPEAHPRRGPAWFQILWLPGLAAATAHLKRHDGDDGDNDDDGKFKSAASTVHKKNAVVTMNNLSDNGILAPTLLMSNPHSVCNDIGSFQLADVPTSDVQKLRLDTYKECHASCQEL
eukprot:scaffold292116_cov15-Tisochrysis_lutea.AAC.2